MADVNIETNSSEYAKQIDEMVRANRKLVSSLKSLGKLQGEMSGLFDIINQQSGNVPNVNRRSQRNVMKFIRMFGGSGRVQNSARGASETQRLQDLNTQVGNIIRAAIGGVSNNHVTSRRGASAVGSGMGRITASAGNTAQKILGGLVNNSVVRRLGKVTAGITLLASAIAGLSAVGSAGYKANIQLKNSLTQLGDGAEYAYGYAKKLNEELNVPLNRSIGNISALAANLKGAGGFSSQGASNMATQSYDLSYKLGLGYGIDPEQVYQEMQRAIINGENSLLQYNVQVSDEVLAGWLAATRGINMYATELSEGAKQAYRYQYIQVQLADVINNKQDLTNSTFARQLEIMNKLEEMGLKLKALFMPLFEWLVTNVKTLVDTLFDGVNTILGLLGKDKIEYQVTGLLDRNKDIVAAVDNQNAAYRKQGELLKKNAKQRLPFDEWISLEALQQLNEDLEKNTDLTGTFGENSGVTGEKDLSKLGLSAEEQKRRQIQDFLKNASAKEIETVIKTTDKDGLLDLWDNFNFIQKGMYGTDMAVRLFQEGEIGKGLEALLFGTVGSFTGIEALKELATGDYIGAIDSGAKTALFWFGGWKGKIAAAAGQLVDVSLKTVGVSDDMAELSSIVSMIGIMIGGWPGLLTAALAVLVPLAAKLGETLGLMANMKMNETFGSEGKWGSLQSWDSRTAANMTYGKGTAEAEAEYYKLMHNKFGATANIPKYASGGIALSPQLAEIGHGREAVIPLDSVEGMQFTRDLAQSISESDTRDVYNDATRNGYTINYNPGMVIASQYSIRQFAEQIRNIILDIDRMEGGAFSGTNQ